MKSSINTLFITHVFTGGTPPPSIANNCFISKNNTTTFTACLVCWLHALTMKGLPRSMKGWVLKWPQRHPPNAHLRAGCLLPTAYGFGMHESVQQERITISTWSTPLVSSTRNWTVEHWQYPSRPTTKNTIWGNTSPMVPRWPTSWRRSTC